MLEQIGRKVGHPKNCLGVRESGTEHKLKIQHIIEITNDYSIISQSFTKTEGQLFTVISLPIFFLIHFHCLSSFYSVASRR